jgi:hypothetical protein
MGVPPSVFLSAPSVFLSASSVVLSEAKNLYKDPSLRCAPFRMTSWLHKLRSVQDDDHFVVLSEAKNLYFL